MNKYYISFCLGDRRKTQLINAMIARIGYAAIAADASHSAKTAKRITVSYCTSIKKCAVPHHYFPQLHPTSLPGPSRKPQLPSHFWIVRAVCSGMLLGSSFCAFGPTSR